MALEGLQLGQYRLVRLLGSGGMGEVYLAEDARISQQVAIKVSRTETTGYPNTDATKDAVRLFQREARAIARLDHPRILPLFAYGEESIHGTSLTYIIMPFRPEGSFASWLQQRSSSGLLSPRDVAYFINQAAEALQYAHDNQIVHQDVKPSNFLIRTNKENPSRPDLLLSDFGIAKLSSATASVSQSVRGTPTYMAPEQWSGEPVYASDQYALAVLAYELLAGRPPFTGRQEQVMYQHFSISPQPPSTFNPQLSRDVDAVILKALAKRPEERFPSISAFANALRQATQNLDASTLIKTPSTPQSSERTVPASNPNIADKTILSSNRGPVPPIPQSLPSSFTPPPMGAYQPQPAARPSGVSTGTAILLVGLALLIIVGGLGFFYLYNMNRSSSNTTNTVTPPSNGATSDVAATASALANNNATATTLANNTNATNTAIASSTATTTVTPTTSSYVQLKSYYSGTASGYADGTVTFSLKSEDQQGNVNMQTTFQLLGGNQKTDIYSCQGTVTTDRHLNLQCSSVSDPSYLLTVQGYIFPDGHMEGTETATNTN